MLVTRAAPPRSGAPYRTGGLLLVWVGVLSLLVACSGKGSSATIHATDFSFTSGVPQTLAAGKVHFVLKNDSKSMLHELWLYPQQQPQLQALLAGKRSGQEVSEDDYLQGIAGKVEDLPAGKTGSFDAQVSPGTYEIGCFQVATINGQTMVHYDMGMHATFTVH
jgi:uncharacterized cupredoxin-like copper-binding protein